MALKSVDSVKHTHRIKVSGGINPSRQVIEIDGERLMGQRLEMVLDVNDVPRAKISAIFEADVDQDFVVDDPGFRVTVKRPRLVATTEDGLQIQDWETVVSGEGLTLANALSCAAQKARKAGL
jgi:hypothetical protein